MRKRGQAISRARHRPAQLRPPARADSFPAEPAAGLERNAQRHQRGLQRRDAAERGPVLRAQRVQLLLAAIAHRKGSAWSRIPDLFHADGGVTRGHRQCGHLWRAGQRHQSRPDAFCATGLQCRHAARLHQLRLFASQHVEQSDSRPPPTPRMPRQLRRRRLRPRSI